MTTREVFRLLAYLPVCLLAAGATAQPVPSARMKILFAEDRRAPTPGDLATLQVGARSRDAETARLALRALGRLERPSVLPSLLPALKHRLPENRAEAANAIAQALQGWSASAAARPGFSETRTAAAGATIAAALTALVDRLAVEEEASVRAALCESIGRLPYRTADEVDRAEAALLDVAGRTATVTDRLGVMKGVEPLVRLHRAVKRPGPPLVALLRTSLGVPDGTAPADAGLSPRGAPSRLPRFDTDPLRDARVRRLALEALMAADAIDEKVVAHAGGDVDPQVRRLAVRAAAVAHVGVSDLTSALDDPAPMVRLEAVRTLHANHGDGACALLLRPLADSDPHVVLATIDELGGCGAHDEAVKRLEDAVSDLSTAGSARGWHRAAHAIVALAKAAPERAATALAQVTTSTIWQLRMYAARAATTIRDRATLERLARDSNDNVVEAAIGGLAEVSGHATDAIYVLALARSGYQAVRSAALALEGSPDRTSAVAALKAALERLNAEGRANSQDTRAAIAATLVTLGSPPAPSKPLRQAPADGPLDAAELRRLAAPRARIAIAGVGIFELALFTSEAPATVLRFAQLAELGYYNGLTFHRVVPNFAIQGGSPGANEFVGDTNYMRDEVGLWPHVRGAVGISTRGRDTGDAQIFIDLVDNPRFDHEYTVFAQVLNGIDVVDQILEGDVIERIEIIP